MKTHQLSKPARKAGGEYVLGAKDLATHACRLIYGELDPGVEPREVRPGRGHEEILMAVVGDLEVSGKDFNGKLAEGEAVHLCEDESCRISNPGKKRAVYVMAGGHSGKDH